MSLRFAILGLVMQNDARREDVTQWLLDNLPLSEQAGLDLANAVAGIASPFSAAGLVALVGLLWGASGMMAAIRAALTNVWKVEQMLLDSIEYAEEDIQKRQLREQQVDAERVLADLRRQLQENGDLLDANERTQVEAVAADLEAKAKGTDHMAIKNAIVALDEATRPFAERIMNKAIRGALEGHSVDEFQG